MNAPEQMIILLHTSKTMREGGKAAVPMNEPPLIDQANRLMAYLKSRSVEQLQALMYVSPSLAERTRQKIQAWSGSGDGRSPAIDAFIGDIYSGLQADKLTRDDRAFAERHLRILSGLYGVLRPHDGVMPYRLEMGYKLPGFEAPTLYEFWGDLIAKQLPAEGTVINLSAVEYTKAVFPYIDPDRVIEPKFLTRHPSTGEPVFVVVHAKIARGAFARWMIVGRITDAARLAEFADLGYRFDAALSSDSQPVFVCDEFGGKGLSIRLQK